MSDTTTDKLRPLGSVEAEFTSLIMLAEVQAERLDRLANRLDALERRLGIAVS